MKKIAVVKNGYDILRIIEEKPDGNTCEFKIVPQVDNENIRIFVMRMFSLSEHIQFDRGRKLEITYHKKDNQNPTKIHLKMINKNDKNDIIYKTLPLERLIDPNVNTEVPIPLFKLIVPNEVLTKKYIKKSDHVVFDIKDSNILEFFMTKNCFIYSNFFDKWPHISTMLLNNCLQFFTNGCNYFMGYNLGASLDYSKRMKRDVNVAIATDVTNDMGLFLSTLNDRHIKTKQMDFLFIENEFYEALCAGSRIVKDNELKEVYKFDLENKKYFSKEEKEKWEKKFNDDFKKYDKFINDNKINYLSIIKYYDGR